MTATPAIETKRTTLRAPLPQDVPWLHELSMSGSNLLRWRFQGRTVSLEEFGASLWAGVHCQFVVAGRQSGKPRGLVVAYEASEHHVKVGVLASPDSHNSGLAVEALLAFVDFLFEHWSFRKIYFEMRQSNAELLTSVTRIAVLEGQLVDHLYSGWAYEDLLLYAVHRSAWLDGRDHYQALWDIASEPKH